MSPPEKHGSGTRLENLTGDNLPCYHMAMKVGVFLLSLLILFSPLGVSAADIGDLDIKIVSKQKTLKAICNHEEDRSTLNGCYNRKWDKIFLRSNLDNKEFVMVFYHEVGHFYTEELGVSELELFTGKKRSSERENVADDFAIWMTTPFLLPPEKMAFFNALGVNKEEVHALLIREWPY